MWRARRLSQLATGTTLLRVACVILLLALVPLAAQLPQPRPGVEAYALLPGEGLAVAGPDGTLHTYGEASRELPMGSLAKLLWMRLEGELWAAQGVEFTCTGHWKGHRCWNPRGHGHVDLATALQESCNLAFLAWAQASAERWPARYGEAAARMRLEAVFGPFAGPRLGTGETLPSIGPEWIGDGSLLRTSPVAMLAWMLAPAQREALARWRLYLQSASGGMEAQPIWWAKTGTAPLPGTITTGSAKLSGPAT